MNNQDDLDAMFGEEDEFTQQEEQRLMDTRPKTCGPVTFHSGTEESLFIYLQKYGQLNNPKNILKTIDEFCYKKHWMMHLGEQKLDILRQSIQKAKDFHYSNPERQSVPFVIVELGSYCGYSAIAIANELDDSRHEQLVCIENHPSCVGWTKRMLEFAGLSSKATVIQSQAQSCHEWRGQLPSLTIDLLFIDHDKASYAKDLLHIEQENLLHSGSIVIADNVLSLGRPLQDYLNHVRDSTGNYSSSTLYEGYLEYTTVEEREDPNMKDGLEVSVFK